MVTEYAQTQTRRLISASQLRIQLSEAALPPFFIFQINLKSLMMGDDCCSLIQTQIRLCCLEHFCRRHVFETMVMRRTWNPSAYFVSSCSVREDIMYEVGSSMVSLIFPVCAQKVWLPPSSEEKIPSSGDRSIKIACLQHCVKC